jgi:ABC-type phosphate transport system permease subunit
MKLFRQIIDSAERAALLAVIGAMAVIAGWLAWHGAGRLGPEFLFADPRAAGTAGGIRPILINTFIIVGLGAAIASALGLAAAIMVVALEERWRKLTEVTELLCEVGLAMPRLLWGLVGSVVFGGVFGLGFSAACGVATLALALGPIAMTSLTPGLRVAYAEAVETGRALGLSETSLWGCFVLPCCVRTLATAMLMTVGRGAGDAAALYLTAGAVLRLIGSPMDSGATLAVYIYQTATSVAGGFDQALSAAFVLFVLTLLLQAPALWALQSKEEHS